MSMRRRFYEIHLYEPPGSWGLDLPVWLDGSEVNFWPLTRGSRVDPNEYADVVFPIDEFGTELGFNLTSVRR